MKSTLLQNTHLSTLLSCIVCGVTLISFEACSQECEQISVGEIKDGYYNNNDLGWSMQLPEGFVQMDQGEYDRILDRGNTQVFGKSKEKGCSQTLIALKNEVDQHRATVIAIADPVAIYPEEFDLISFIRKQNNQVALENKMQYSDKDTSILIGGNEFRKLESEFVGAKHVYTSLYQSTIGETLIFITLNANNEEGIRNLERHIESSSFLN